MSQKVLRQFSIMDDSHEPQVKVLDNWQLAVGLHGQQEKYYDAGYVDSSWQEVKLGSWSKRAQDADEFDGIGWYRLEFNIDIPEQYYIPLKFKLLAKTDALIYLNGEILGRYNDIGWQREFYMPQCWLNANGSNIITIAVRSDRKEGGLYEASVSPYNEFSVRKHMLKIEY